MELAFTSLTVLIMPESDNDMPSTSNGKQTKRKRKATENDSKNVKKSNDQKPSNIPEPPHNDQNRDFYCNDCQKTIKGTLWNWNDHWLRVHNKEKTKKRADQLSCPSCDRKFSTLLTLRDHIDTAHLGGNVQIESNDQQSNTDQDGIGEELKAFNNRGKDDVDAREYLESYEKGHYIEDYCKQHGNTADVNIKTEGGLTLDKEVLKKGIKRLFKALKGYSTQVKVSLGVLLRSRTTGGLRYYYPGKNTSLLPNPFILETKSDGRILFDTLKNVDLNYILNTQYTDSDWEVVQICNIRFIGTFLQR